MHFRNKEPLLFAKYAQKGLNDWNFLQKSLYNCPVSEKSDLGPLHLFKLWDSKEFLIILKSKFPAFSSNSITIAVLKGISFSFEPVYF